MSHLGPGLGLDAATARRRPARFFLAPAFRLDGRAPALAADVVRDRHALAGAQVAASALLAVSGGSKNVFDASGALVVSAANAPAYTYRAGKRRLLIEGPATNVLNYPADFTQSDWVKDNVTVTLSAGWSLLRETTSPSYHRVGRSSIAVVAGTVYTLSALVRRAGRRYVFWRTSFVGGLSNITFDLNTVSVLYAGAAYAARIRQIATDVFLIEVTFTTAGTAGACTIGASPTDPGTGAGAWAGNAGLGLDIRYMQLEAGSIATSLVDGGASAGSRVADVVQLTSGAAAVLQGAAASLAWRGRVRAAVASQPLVGLTSGYALLRGGVTPAELRLDGSSSTALTLGSPIPGEIGAAIGWDGTGRAGAVNGAAAVSDATALDRARTDIFLGGNLGLAAGCALEIDEIVAWAARGSGAALATQARVWA